VLAHFHSDISDPALGCPHSLSHALQSLWSGYA
jgi:hypothetical protein